MMSMFSTNEHVPHGVTTGAATPAPTGINRNPFHGFRTSATNFNNTSNVQGFEAWPGFREPVLQFRFFSTTTVPNAMAGPERGSGALIQDGTGLVTVNPGMRTSASGHLGALVIHVLTADPTNFPPLAQPGIPVTPTSNLMLNPADPNFFLLTPAPRRLHGVEHHGLQLRREAHLRHAASLRAGWPDPGSWASGTSSRRSSSTSPPGPVRRALDERRTRHPVLSEA